ncbi:hypothetical protein GIB67_032368 [Kingdonia uniflora]|uniref:Protein CHROMATIN REMODELING 8 n=1 Tax=Kingdonia uniflora TaxID=39325 RepID=A0A7J7MIP3_9MAGN|nr:hypothetical protein GIB67_032368 [Kingdonia uniflora]
MEDEEEEEDKILLSSLGVTSANPEDIERDLLTEVVNDGGDGSELGRKTEKHILQDENGNDATSTSRARLFSKLRAIEVEIDAVAASIPRNEDLLSVSNDSNNREDGKDAREGKNVIQVSANGLDLQCALATDRLRSLEKTKAQFQKELSKFDSDGLDKVIEDLVKEEAKPKRRLKRLQKSSKDSKKCRKTVSYDEDVDFDAVLDAASTGLIETERDELVRKGILTPFHQLKGFERRLQQPGPSNTPSVVRAEEGQSEDIALSSVARAIRSISKAAKARPTTKLLDVECLPKVDPPTRPFQRLKTPLKPPHSPKTAAEKNRSNKSKYRRPLPDKKWRKIVSREEELSEGSEEERQNLITSDDEEENQDVEDADDTEPSYVTVEGGFKIPKAIFTKLFDYQKVGVQWLWELHCQRAGGIIGDEMGLGKTIQVIAFLGALHFSKMYKPSIIICPVTLLRQWRREARKWYPHFHVEILHDSAQVSTNRKKRSKSDESDYESSEGSSDCEKEKHARTKTTKKWDYLIGRVLRSKSGLLITTYEQLRILGVKLLDIEWGYAVLDEGHRIRNPNADVTLACKQLQTVHRIIMTGAPIQNKLTELWSLFDFVFPGKLGVLPVFEAEFAVPISIGGYANASPLQVSTAYRCAVVLRDLIMPYLLRRMKADVNAQLTKKTEHVLFCSLTSEQRSIYRAFLASSEVEQIFNGNRNSLYGIDVMRKICNHPDLLEREHSSHNPDYGNPERSGKMKVVVEVLKAWKDQGHRALLFTQTQQMLDILESFLIKIDYTYRRMDGLTPVRQRMALIDEFNNSDDIFVFILTTKVGGLGTNLIGANRVIIFDPDWNPSTDMQARERAWRIGQTRDVTIYRLITRGTIEEKVYHRQIYKHYLTNKILKNPQQRRFFKARDMKDLFILKEDGEGASTETSNIFSELSEDVNVIEASKVKPVENKCPDPAVTCSCDAVVGRVSNSLAPGPSTMKGKEKADQSGEVDEEANVLKNLFDAYGIHSAINHDLIMNANDEEKMRLDEQASQVAQRAAEALRQSRMIRSRDSISVPTWTGRSGAAGAPPSVRKKFGSTVNSQLVSHSKTLEGSSSKQVGLAVGASAGKVLSSSELLARIRGTEERARADGLGHQLSNNIVHQPLQAGSSTSRSSQNLSGVPPEVLIRQICTFLQGNGGHTSSAIIVRHFKDRIPSNDLPLFKSLLKEIATLKKDRNGSTWVLKAEYHQ